MEAESALRAIALADPVVVGLVGLRWYPMELPQPHTIPTGKCSVTVRRISGVRHHDIPFAYPLVQVTVWADKWSTARAGATALRDALHRVKATEAAVGVEFKMISQVNEVELKDPETGRYTAPLDFRLIHREGD